jgi:sugar phosphate isomerase/epimerase
MSLFVSTTFIKDNTSLITALNILKSINVKSVEIGSNHIFEKNLNYIKRYNFNYIVHNYFPVPKKPIIVNISSLDENIRKLSIQHIKKSIIFCNNLNAKLYTFHPGFVKDPIRISNKKNNYDFVWKSGNINQNLINKAKLHLLNSLDKIIKFSKKYNVNIAIETEGSYYKNKMLMMQRPEEYDVILSNYSKDDLGINLNIGHLNLSSKFYNFDKFEFINYIIKYIVAIELSHNNGFEDQHLPLKSNAWYWQLIKDKRFKKIIKILEFRNTNITKLINNIKLFNKKVENHILV